MMNHLSSIQEARERIRDFVFSTPLLPVERLKEALGFTPYLKLENLQSMGAFKIRGAANAVLSLSEETRRLGVVTASSGNHGRALATMAKALEIPCTIFLPDTVTAKKLQNIKSLGVAIKLVDPLERIPLAQSYARDHGMHFVHPFDQEEVIYGQGTIGLELLEQKPNLRQVFVPIGGGGLIAGITLAMKQLKPEIKVIGLEPAKVPKVSSALRDLPCEVQPTLADALMTPKLGTIPLSIIRDQVDEIITVEDKFMIEALALLTEVGLIVEPSSSIGIAACLQKGPLGSEMEDSAFIISGGNTSLADLLHLIAQ